MRELTPKQKKFVEAYNGSVREAAKIAGYEYSAARRLATQCNIKQALQARAAKDIKPTIASREQRQTFWTDVMGDSEESMTNRLRAAELLGKSEADFTDNLQVGGGLKLTRVRKKYDGTVDDN